MIRAQAPLLGKLQITIRDDYAGKVIYNDISSSDNRAIFDSLKGIQITESEGHPGWARLKSGKLNGDIGGPFTMTKRWAESVNSEPSFLSGSVKDRQADQTQISNYWGPVLPIAPNLLSFPPFQAASDSDLNELGTTAIARCSPSNPTADASVFLKETLTEGIPHLFIGQLKQLRGMTNSQRRKALAGSYLNLEFGWKPFLSDLDKMSQAILHANDIMSQYERDSGKVVRRSYYFPEFESTETSTFRTGVSPWYNPSGGRISDPNLTNQGSVIRTRRVYKKTWFKGAFTYYVPSDLRFSSRNGMAYAVIQARKVHGLSLTPDAVWNMLPWSWAVDWFTNTSDVLSNFSDWAVDNQVLRYGYIMQHSLCEDTYTFVGETGFRNRSFVVPPLKLVTETKLRRRATPYGFGLDFGSFTNRQKAIVAALGFSRGK